MHFPVNFEKFLRTPFLQNIHFLATASVFIFLKYEELAYFFFRVYNANN